MSLQVCQEDKSFFIENTDELDFPIVGEFISVEFMEELAKTAKSWMTKNHSDWTTFLAYFNTETKEFQWICY